MITEACSGKLPGRATTIRRVLGSHYRGNEHLTAALGAFESTGRLSQLESEERFSRSDGLLVLFLHDIEKPWSFIVRNGRLLTDDQGLPLRSPAMADKALRKRFAESKIAEYGVVLNPALRNALQYVEGIRDSDYSQFDRRMRPLAALCHACDMLSARAFYNFPLEAGDAWGAMRSEAHSRSRCFGPDVLCVRAFCME